MLTSVRLNTRSSVLEFIAGIHPHARVFGDPSDSNSSESDSSDSGSSGTRQWGNTDKTETTVRWTPDP